MANPSLKNGYLSIATELVEQFALHNIPGNEMRILWCVMRKTWGWSVGDRKKDWDIISLTQFQDITNMNRRNVSRSIKALVAKRLLLKNVSTYKINQNHDEWVVAKRLPCKQVVSNVVSGRGKRGSLVGVKRLPTIDIKDTNTIDTVEARKASPLQEVVNTYYHLKDFKDPKWCKQQFSRHCKPAKQLLEVSGELTIALANLRLAPTYFTKRKLSWTLETVIKCYPEICKEKEKEVWV